MPNAFGLSRNIPAGIKRAVRQRCGFGCVVCGASIYEYDHFEPNFIAAREHLAESIILLCPSHHAQKTKGLIPVEILRHAKSEPAAIRDERTAQVLPYFSHVPSLQIGGGLLTQETEIPIQIRGKPLIQFMPPEDGSDVSRINAKITSEDGESILRIAENEWIVETGVWDYEWVGQRMTIRDAQKRVSLQLTLSPPKLIALDRLRYKEPGLDLTVTETEITVNGSTLRDCMAIGCRVGLGLG